VNKIDKSNGLINNTVLSLYQDFENNIWLGLDNGISVININSPFKIYSDDNGVLGTVYASKVYNEFFIHWERIKVCIIKKIIQMKLLN
jgi:ligand-binding sensor domain-containing protein